MLCLTRSLSHFSLIGLVPIALAAACQGSQTSRPSSVNVEARPAVARDRAPRENSRLRRNGVPTPPANWVGIVSTGQSLSVGAAGSPAISTTQPSNNLKLRDDGPDPKYALDGSGVYSVVPLIEPFRGALAGWPGGEYPNNISGETPSSSMGNEISALWFDRTQNDYVTVHSNVGWGGQCMRNIDRTDPMRRAYPGTLSEARTYTRLADAAGLSFIYGAVILTHGECDAGNPSYEAELYRLIVNYNEDLPAITGQTQSIPLLISQQSVITRPSGGSAVAVWKAGIDHPGEVFCVGPKYQYQYAGDRLHMEAAGYRRLGVKYAEVFDLVVNQGQFWTPVQPNSAVRTDNVITVSFDVPNPPLAFDEDIHQTHQTVHTAWANGRGFEVSDSTGELRISSVDLVSDNTVQITLANVPTGANLMLRYAFTQDGMGNQGGTDLGMRGQLRDSDSLVGYDVESIASNVANGSPNVTSVMPNAFLGRTGRDIVDADFLPQGANVLQKVSHSQVTLSSVWTGPSGTANLTFHHDEHNYCVQFEMPVL